MEIKHEDDIKTIIATDELGDYRVVLEEDSPQDTLHAYLGIEEERPTSQSVFRLDGSWVAQSDVVTRCNECRDVIEFGQKYYADEGSFCISCWKMVSVRRAL